jgi:hypothetical protein
MGRLWEDTFRSVRGAIGIVHLPPVPPAQTSISIKESVLVYHQAMTEIGKVLCPMDKKECQMPQVVNSCMYVPCHL